MLVKGRIPFGDIDGLSLKFLRSYIAEREELCRDHGAIGEIYIENEFYGYDGGFEIYMVFKREETDKEREKRLKVEAKAKEAKEKNQGN